MQVPSQIAQYRLNRELGRGAMGVVFEAVDLNIGRRVALKLILQQGEPNDSAYQEARKRFLQEGRSAGALHHPHIVTIYEVDEHDALIFMAMEFVEGESLDHHLRREAMAADKALRVLRGVALALDYAHQHSVVHRDVKPANILLAGDGAVKLTDFGIAKSMEQAGLTRPGFVVGTPWYMSPEQIRGVPVEGSSDQFSFGVLAYELLSGNRPFQGADTTAICYQIVHEQPHSLRSSKPELPLEVDSAVRQALAKNPKDRFSSCIAFVDQLERVLARSGERKPGETDSITRRSIPWPVADLSSEKGEHAQPARRVWVLPAVVSVVLVLGLVLYFASRAATPVAAELPKDPVADGSMPGNPPAREAEPDSNPTGSTKPLPASSPSITQPSREASPESAPLNAAPPPAGMKLENALPLKPQWAMVSGSAAQSGAANGVGPPATPRVQWSFPVTGAVRGSVVIGGDGTAYFGDQNGVLRGVRAGSEVWSSFQKGAIPGSPVLLDNGFVVATMEPRILFVQQDGASGWSLPIAVASTASPVEQGGTVYAGSTDGNAYAIRDGKVLWRQSAGGAVRHTVSVDRHLVYVVAGSVLHALGADDGSLRWSQDFDEDIAAAPSTTGQGAVYVTTSAGRVYALNHSGRVQWVYAAAAPILTSASLHPNGSILFGCADRHLYAVRNAELLWKFQTGGPVRASPIVDRNGVAYFGSTNGDFHAVGADGKSEWTLAIGAGVTGPASLGADGTLFAVTQSRSVVALR